MLSVILQTIGLGISRPAMQATDACRQYKRDMTQLVDFIHTVDGGHERTPVAAM
jgi:hypothetical protein